MVVEEGMNTSLAFYPLICNLTGVDYTTVPASTPLGMMLMTSAMVIITFTIIFLGQMLIRFVLRIITMGWNRE